ncbi:nuclear transport factor 2 family protein [Lysobacter sp. TAB13]|uniref:nuclear transport factor 2 family protein n=1 Tax=Lysobacter sp. TAB13 TaxID=3233065 RepID=UPI003F96D22E
MKYWRWWLIAALLAVSWLALAQAESAQEAVVRRYVQAWNDDDVEAFLALASQDARTYRRDRDDEGLAGASIAGADAGERARFYRGAFAKRPHVRVDIVQMQAVDDIVMSRERVSGGADGKIADELTVYQVRDRKICNVWHVKRRSR